MNVLALNKGNLKSVWEKLTDELLLHRPELSPNRAGELAASRLCYAIRIALSDIESRTRSGKMSEAEVQFYDSVYVDDWQYGRDLEMYSKSRTMISDKDSEKDYITRPLDGPPLPDNHTVAVTRRKANEVYAESIKTRVEIQKQIKREQSRLASIDFAEHQKKTTEREVKRARWFKQNRRTETESLEAILRRSLSDETEIPDYILDYITTFHPDLLPGEGKTLRH